MKVQIYCQWPSILTYLAVLVVAFPAFAVTYQTSYDSSSCKTNKDRLKGQLSHELTGYSKATFAQKAG